MLKRLFSHYIAEEVRPMLRLGDPARARGAGLDDHGHRGHHDGRRQAHSAEAMGAVSLGSILYMAVAIFGTGTDARTRHAGLRIPTGQGMWRIATARSSTECT